MKKGTFDSSRDGQHLGGGRRLSMGNSEVKCLLFGKLLEINSNKANSLEMQSYVEVDATGLEKEPVKVTSPLYKFKLNPPQLEAYGRGLFDRVFK